MKKTGDELRVFGNSKENFEKCIPEAVKKAKYWSWLKKSGKEKVFDAFNDVRNNLEIRGDQK